MREVVGRWTRRPAEVSQLNLLGRRSELEPWLRSVEPSVPTRVIPWPDPPYSVAAQVLWPLGLSRAVRESDAVFFPHYDAPAIGRGLPYAVTVHDLTQFLLVDRFPAWKRAAGRLLLQRVVRRATRVLTVSETTRRELARAGIAPEKTVTVVPNGVGDHFRPLTPAEERGARARWGEYVPFVLLVGWDRPHKNAELALAVLGQLRERGHDCRLLLAGPGGRMRGPIRRQAGRLGLALWVRELGVVPPEALRELYALATAVLVPSLHEGFGLPLLEGLACGAPVLASDRGALPEVAGPAPTLPPTDVGPWVEAVERLLLAGPPPGSCERGLTHARHYNWSEASRKILAILREVAEENRV